MRYRIGAATIMAAALFATGSAAQTGQEAVSGGDRSCDGMKADHHVHRGRVIIREAYVDSRFPDATPMKGSEKRDLRRHKFCVVPNLQNKIERYRTRMAERYDRRLEHHLAEPKGWCSPTPIPSGGGCWEIPVGCVMSESGGSWGAANASGAVGPYQLLGHGAPFPVYTYDQAMAHHRIAAALYASSGLAPWVAPGC